MLLCHRVALSPGQRVVVPSPKIRERTVLSDKSNTPVNDGEAATKSPVIGTPVRSAYATPTSNTYVDVPSIFGTPVMGVSVSPSAAARDEEPSPSAAPKDEWSTPQSPHAWMWSGLERLISIGECASCRGKR